MKNTDCLENVDLPEAPPGAPPSARGNVAEIYVPDFTGRLLRPLYASRVSAGFPSPAEDYIESRIDLNKDLILHPDFTFYVRIWGDSMETLLSAESLLVVDRMCEVEDRDLIVGCVGDELCVKRFRLHGDGSVWLHSENPCYEPLRIAAETDFRIWGKVLHSIRSFW